MRRGHVSRVGRDLPDEPWKPGYVPVEPEDRELSRASARGTRNRVVRRNGEWFVEFGQGVGRKDPPWK